MPITETQRQDRKNHLGSSDVPAIMGYSRFHTPWDIWAEKTGRIVKQLNPEPEDYQEVGNDYEPGVIKWAQRKGYIGEVDTNPEHLEFPIIGTMVIVHPDAIEKDTGRPVEVKIEGLYGPIVNYWGDADTNEVSEYACIQGHAHLMATDQDLCHVPAHLGFRGRQYFFVKRDEGLVKVIREQVVAFWEGCVLANVVPAAAPSPDVVKRIRRLDDPDPVTIPDDLVNQWQEASDLKNQWTKQAEEAKARIRAILDGRANGICGLGTLTDNEQSRKGYVVQPTNYRVLRLKEKK